MNWQFSLGLIVALPVSLLANLVTPKIQEILAPHLRMLAERHKRGMGQDLVRVRRYREDRASFQEALLNQIWLETQAGKITTLGIGLLILFFLPGIPAPPQWAEGGKGFAAILVLVSMIPSLSGVNLHNDAIRLKDFERYERKVGQAIEEDGKCLMRNKRPRR